MKDNYKFVRSNQLSQNILIVDGVSATGKKLMCAYLQTFPRVQKMEVDQMFRKIANLSTFNKIDQQTTSTILNLYADTFLQNTLLSRDMNFRPYDGSSIFQSYKKLEYIKRLFYKDGDNVHNIIKKKKPILNIMTHYGLPSIDVFFNAFKERLKFISCKRHPVYCFDHWVYIVENVRKKNKRFTSLNIEDQNKNEIPWYYLRSSDFLNQEIGDILIEKLFFVEELSNSSFNKIPIDLRKSFLEIPFENFIMDTFKYQNLISKFIGDKPSKSSFLYLKKEKLPSKFFSKRKMVRSGSIWKVNKNEKEDQKNFDERMNRIRNISSNQNFKRFIEYSISYEEKFDIKSFSTKEYLNKNKLL